VLSTAYLATTTRMRPSRRRTVMPASWGWRSSSSSRLPVRKRYQ
jgi:hypothetical protein